MKRKPTPRLPDGSINSKEYLRRCDKAHDDYNRSVSKNIQDEGANE